MPPRICAIIVMFLWALCYPLITIGLQSAPHLTFATLRAVLAGFVLLAAAVLLRKSWPDDLQSWSWIIVAGLGMTGLGYYGMFHAAEFVSPGLATVVANSQPLIAAVLAYLFLSERLGPHVWLGLALGFAGIFVIAAPQFLDGRISMTIGIAYVLIAALGVAIGNVAIKKLSGRTDAAIAMGLQLLIGAIPLGLVASMTEDHSQIDWSPAFLANLFGLAIPGTAVAFWLWQFTLARIELSKANAFSFLVPVIGLTIGVTYFGEQLGFLTMAGIVIATSGVVIASMDSIGFIGSGRETAG